MELTGVYNPNNVMGGVYDSPYWLNINGVETLAICDDFTTDISVGQTWSASQYSLSDVSTAGLQKFNTTPVNGQTLAPTWLVGTTTLTIRQEYAAAALLAEDLFANLNSSTAGNSALVGEYSYAIWTIFDPSAISGYNGQIDLTTQGVIANLRTQAFDDVLRGASATISIYTPTPFSASQEFLVVTTPEASAMGTLIVDLLGLAGVVFVLRRRLTSRLSN